MKQKPRSRRIRNNTKSVLRLPDLEHAKAAVRNSLVCPDAQRGYRHAIDEFLDWYCSEPRWSLNRTVVLRYRTHVESRQLAPGMINLRLGAVRRLAYEAADCGLFSAGLAAGIRRVKCVRKLEVLLGNWLTAEQGQALWQTPDSHVSKGSATEPARSPAVMRIKKTRSCRLDIGSFDEWLAAAGMDREQLFRRVRKAGRAWGEGMTVKAVAHRERVGLARLAPHDLRQSCARLCHDHASRGELGKSNSLWGTFLFKPPNAILAASSGFDQR